MISKCTKKVTMSSLRRMIVQPFVKIISTASAYKVDFCWSVGFTTDLSRRCGGVVADNIVYAKFRKNLLIL